jgi:hypothetical protein
MKPRSMHSRRAFDIAVKTLPGVAAPGGWFPFRGEIADIISR